MEPVLCGPQGPEDPEGPPVPETGFSCASFNQDTTSLALGTDSGFRLFSLTNVDTLDCIYRSTDTPDVGLVERLYSSSLVVVVSAQTPQKLHIYHFKKGTEICNYSYPRPVQAVRLNRQRLVVCLQESLFVHNIKDMKLLQTLMELPSNPRGLCALSSSGPCSYLAYPSCPSTGELQVYDASALSPVTVIPAHHSPLAALSFNASASRLASASRKGTVIRVFSIPQGQRLFEFRRGMKRCVDISCLSFSPDGHFLCTSSNTETVHIFRLEDLGPSREDEASSWGSYVGRMFSAASTYLPAPVSDMMSQDRAFATAQLPSVGCRNTCALTVIQKLPRLLVATRDGTLYIYTFDPAEGGRCHLSHTHKLLDELQDHTEVKVSETSESSGPGNSCPTYAATAALPPAPGLTAATLTGYSEDGGCREGEVIPEHELAAGPVRLDDESEFPPIKCRDGRDGVLVSLTFSETESFCKL
ncbi:WD repeat domain phosphoinositide-interacting protein 1 isoform X2 [Eucyclogobius newberryi]|uniref:WD repeat domain phosphoinositide-interacting protein 1 isoform X2 n=1 Tax=Eucyclogobius newberryi TaxID=166745 RepID=UPI003B592A8A